jgi:hypothetical protein
VHNIYYKREHQYIGGRNDIQAGANVTTTMGSRRENSRPLLCKHPRKGTKYMVWTIGRCPSGVEKGVHKF